MDEKKAFLHYLKYQKNYSVLTLQSYERELTDFLLFIGKESRIAIYGSEPLITYSLIQGITFAAGMIILLTGVRMILGEIIPSFKGIADKLAKGSIPALDIPMIFPYGPNALLIGFIVAMITSIITLLLTSGMFPTVVIPLISTCFFETGCAAIIGNAKGGVRGCIIGAAACGIVMVFLVGFGAYFFNNTIQQWMLVYGGQDFSLWGIVEGFIARLIA